jgi:hypothetical protein
MDHRPTKQLEGTVTVLGWWLLLFYIVPIIFLTVGALPFFYGIGAQSAATEMLPTRNARGAFVSP